MINHQKLIERLRQSRLKEAYFSCGGNPDEFENFEALQGKRFDYDVDRDCFTLKGRTVNLRQIIEEESAHRPALKACFQQSESGSAAQGSNSNFKTDRPVLGIEDFNAFLANPRNFGVDADSIQVPDLIKRGVVRFIAANDQEEMS